MNRFDLSDAIISLTACTEMTAALVKYDDKKNKWQLIGNDDEFGLLKEIAHENVTDGINNRRKGAFIRRAMIKVFNSKSND